MVDVFDALTSKRPYKGAHSFAEAMAVIENGIGSYFDPRLAKAFCTIAEPLYWEIRNLPQHEAEVQLQAIIRKYFFAAA